MVVREHFDVGDVIRLSAAFTSDDVGVDPDGVVFRVLTPSRAESTWTYNTDPEVIRSSPGNYYLELEIDEPGTWYYRIEGTGNYQSADERQFLVSPSEFTTI